MQRRALRRDLDHRAGSDRLTLVFSSRSMFALHLVWGWVALPAWNGRTMTPTAILRLWVRVAHHS